MGIGSASACRPLALQGDNPQRVDCFGSGPNSRDKDARADLRRVAVVISGNRWQARSPISWISLEFYRRSIEDGVAPLV
jgi:hypothetical protein